MASPLMAEKDWSTGHYHASLASKVGSWLSKTHQATVVPFAELLLLVVLLSLVVLRSC